MHAYYNEIDPYAAQWLRNLIAAGHIAPGDVDERSIVDVRADDLRGYRQCHFFAGVGVWSYALRLARWPDELEIWTGSCPCQPFSSAGRSGGFDDGRHLWPHWSGLIGERRPRVVFGEQVASADGLAWLDFVCADLEGAGYAVGANDLCAAGFGAPHIRQRIFFVANTAGIRQPEHERRSGREEEPDSTDCGVVGDAERSERRPHQEVAAGGEQETGFARDAGFMGNAGAAGLPRIELETVPGPRRRKEGRAVGESGCSFWSDCDWLHCRDGKARPVEPGTFPLVAGAPARVGRLRAYGNAIVAPVAAEFIGAYMNTRRSGDHGG